MATSTGHTSDAARPPKPAQQSATTSIFILAPINPLAPPFYLAMVPSSIIVAAADAGSARKIAAESALSLDAEAWLDEALSSCDVLAPAEPGIIARDFSPTRPTAPVVDLGPPPSNKDVPQLQGDGAVGAVLTCTMGNWENMSVEPHSYSFAWQSDGYPNSMTGEEYVVLPPDIGHTITCVVTATNPAGSAAAPPSNAVTIAG